MLPLDSWTYEFYFLGTQPLIMVVDLGHILCPRECVTGGHLQGGVSTVPLVSHPIRPAASGWCDL